MVEPLSLDSVLHYPDSIAQVQASDAGVFWLATIAAEDGRTTVRRWVDGEVADLTPEANVRSRAMEYGGGAYSVDGAAVAYVDDRTRRVWLRDGDQSRALTPEQGRFVYGGLRLAEGTLLAVREDHEAQPEARTEIVELSLTGDNADGGRVVASGADFYAGIVLSEGRLAWYQWNHPDMSWDTSEVWTATLADPTDARPVFARQGVSAQFPAWLPDGSLAYVADESGFWNWQTDSGQVWRVARDCSGPTWVLNPAVACPVGERLFASVEYVDGKGILALRDVQNKAITYPLPGTTEINSVAAHGEVIYVVAEFADRPSALLQLCPDGSIRQLAGPDSPAPVAAAPKAAWADGPAGPVHSWLYLPEGEAPPLIVFTHGGPTAMTTASYDAQIQFWASRGFAVLDVNYSGSTGFGRAYRDRLRGQWGELDVADAAAAVRAVSDRIDPTRVAITGGSAGGFTTLKSLVSTDVYAAGISRYGIGYLPTLATDTHKAESRYLDGLVAPWPDGSDVYEERSPINHLDKLSTPMLILQGLDDKVVPPNQAEQMAAAVREAGQPVALIMFEGEGHGFRTMAARRRSLEAQVSFLEQVFGMNPSPDVPALEIENLPNHHS